MILLLGAERVFGFSSRQDWNCDLSQGKDFIHIILLNVGRDPNLGLLYLNCLFFQRMILHNPGLTYASILFLRFELT